jgi:uncharacterized protein (TIGR02453 family)
MIYFKPAFIKFFKDLSKNNSSEWFNENRKVYEKEVKEPFSRFVDDLISSIRKVDPSVRIKASDAITRINKDIRFSKDKTPYNLHVGAIISPTGKKSKEYPGLYIQLGADKISVFGGAYMLEKENLQKVRKHIAKDPASFKKLISQKDFINSFGTIQGEKNKVLPPEFKSLLDVQPLIANKSFYFNTDLDSKLITGDKLADTVMKYYKAGKPVNDYLINAMGFNK